MSDQPNTNKKTSEIDAELARSIEQQAIAAANAKPNQPLQPNLTKTLNTEEFTIEDEPLSIMDIHKQAQSGKFAQDFEQIVGAAGMTKEALELERFMHEVMVITVAEDSDEEALPVVAVTVNGVMHPILRGVPTEVKRKYVEALARAKETKYKQVLQDPSDPSSLVMIPRTALAYNFSVDQDTQRGRQWLKMILAQKA